MRLTTIILILFSQIALIGQCTTCFNSSKTVTAQPTGPAPLLYSWYCSNGQTGTSQSITVASVNTPINCFVTVVDANNCASTQAIGINPLYPPSVNIQANNCVISISSQTSAPSFTCTALLQYRVNSSGTWTTIVGANLPYTATQNGQYRYRLECLCGSSVYYINSNILTVSSCACTPFSVIDIGNCQMAVIGSVPCSGQTYTVWQYVNNSINCSSGNPCDQAQYTQYLTTTSPIFVVNNDGCYYVTVNCPSTGNFCSNTICFDDNCDVSCTGNILVSKNGCNMNVTWASCSTNLWRLQYFANGVWNTYSTGNTTPPTSFSIPFNGTWRVFQQCTNGCVYTSASLTFTGCGNPPCGVTTTVTTSLSPTTCITSTTITANVQNCGGTGFSPSYQWSNGATTQSITVGTGTYTVTVTGCCTTATTTRTVTCSNPCSNFTTSITGPTTVCNNASITLNRTTNNGTAPFTQIWKVNNQTAGSSSSFVFNGASYNIGSNTVTLTVTDANGCQATASYIVVVDDCSTCDCTPTLSFNQSNCTLTLNTSGSNCSNYNSYALLKWLGSSCSGGNTTVQTGPASFPITYNVNENTGWQLIISGPNCNTKISTCTVSTNCACDDNPTLSSTVLSCNYEIDIVDASTGSNTTFSAVVGTAPNGEYSIYPNDPNGRVYVNCGSGPTVIQNNVGISNYPSINYSIFMNGVNSSFPTTQISVINQGVPTVLNVPTTFSGGNPQTTASVLASWLNSLSLGATFTSGPFSVSMQVLPSNTGGFNTSGTWVNSSGSQSFQISSSSESLIKTNNYVPCSNMAILEGINVSRSWSGSDISVTYNNIVVINSANMFFQFGSQSGSSNTTTTCNSYQITVNNECAGASYVWSNGATTETITVQNTGTYSVTITCPDGCVYNKSITI